VRDTGLEPPIAHSTVASLTQGEPRRSGYLPASSLLSPVMPDVTEFSGMCGTCGVLWDSNQE
jgi:hypothetical protein